MISERSSAFTSQIEAFTWAYHDRAREITRMLSARILHRGIRAFERDDKGGGLS